LPQAVRLQSWVDREQAAAGPQRSSVVPDSTIARREDLVYAGVNLDNLIEKMQKTSRSAGMRSDFVVTDACGNTAFPPGTRGGSRGFTAVQKQSGLMIAFATVLGKRQLVCMTTRWRPRKSCRCQTAMRSSRFEQ
jgi:hypothetical protein